MSDGSIIQLGMGVDGMKAITRVSLATKRLIASLKWKGQGIPLVSNVSGRVINVADVYTASSLLRDKTASNVVSIDRTIQAIHGEQPLSEITAVTSKASTKLHLVPRSIFNTPKQKGLDEDRIDNQELQDAAEKLVGITDEDIAVDEGSIAMSEAEISLGLAPEIRKEAVKSRKAKTTKDIIG